jgi:hypothetical protein
MTEEVKQPEAQQPAAAEAQTPPAGPELTINDLNAVKTIIDVATSRGAFKAAEMESVGKIYNKLNTFLESVAPANKGQ